MGDLLGREVRAAGEGDAVLTGRAGHQDGLDALGEDGVAEGAGVGLVRAGADGEEGDGGVDRRGQVGDLGQADRDPAGSRQPAGGRLAAGGPGSVRLPVRKQVAADGRTARQGRRSVLVPAATPRVGRVHRGGCGVAVHA